MAEKIRQTNVQEQIEALIKAESALRTAAEAIRLVSRWPGLERDIEGLLGRITALRQERQAAETTDHDWRLMWLSNGWHQYCTWCGVSTGTPGAAMPCEGKKRDA